MVVFKDPMSFITKSRGFPGVLPSVGKCDMYVVWSTVHLVWCEQWLYFIINWTNQCDTLGLPPVWHPVSWRHPRRPPSIPMTKNMVVSSLCYSAARHYHKILYIQCVNYIFFIKEWLYGFLLFGICLGGMRSWKRVSHQKCVGDPTKDVILKETKQSRCHSDIRGNSSALDGSGPI